MQTPETMIPLPASDDAYAARQATIAHRADLDARDVAAHRAALLATFGEYPALRSQDDRAARLATGGAGASFDPNGPEAPREPIAPRRGLAADVMLATFDDGARAALYSAALVGAMLGRLGGVRKATGSSSEHLGPIAAEDHETADDAVSAAWLEIRERIEATGARWRVPGAMVAQPIDPNAIGSCSDVVAYRRSLRSTPRDRRTPSAIAALAGKARRIIDDATGMPRKVEAQRVRAPEHVARSLAKRFGQRRSKDRIRMRDGISPLATDHRTPDIFADVEARDIVATVSPRLREAAARALARYSREAGTNGNAIRDARKVLRTVGEAPALALVATGELAIPRA